MNHKTQAFIFTCLVFSPLLLFAMFNKPQKIQIKGDDQISLMISQFVVQKQEVQNILQPTPQKKVETKKIKKEDKYAKKVPKKERKKEEEKEIAQKEVPQTPAPHADNAPEQISTLAYGKNDDPFLKAVKQAIDEAAVESYPRQARRMKLSGEVLLEFVWLDNKTLKDVRILHSSGHSILDKNVLQVIAKASHKFPRHHQSVRVRIPVIYDLR